MMKIDKYIVKCQYKNKYSDLSKNIKTTLQYIKKKSFRDMNLHLIYQNCIFFWDGARFIQVRFF